MKVYECTTECYADDSRRYREGDRRVVADNYNHQTLDEKFKLVSADKPVKKDNSEANDLIAGVNQYAKEHGITVAKQKKIFIAAKAVDPSD